MSFSTISRKARSLLFLGGYVCSTLLFGILLPFVTLLPYPWRYRILTAWAAFIVIWLRWTCGITHRVEGDWPKDRPVILFSRHESAWETIVFSRIFPRQVWVVKQELLKIPFFGWGIASLGAIAIAREKRHAALKQLVEQGTRALEQGQWVVLFPEGTRVLPGETKKFNIGGAMLAARTEIPVLPVWHDAGTFWSRGLLGKIPGTITVRVGPLIDSRGKKPAEINQIAQDWIDNQKDNSL